jgi:hypothetical protein
VVLASGAVDGALPARTEARAFRKLGRARVVPGQSVVDVAPLGVDTRSGECVDLGGEVLSVSGIAA